jgi:hypothetical protein
LPGFWTYCGPPMWPWADGWAAARKDQAAARRFANWGPCEVARLFAAGSARTAPLFAKRHNLTGVPRRSDFG